MLEGKRRARQSGRGRERGRKKTEREGRDIEGERKGEKRKR